MKQTKFCNLFKLLSIVVIFSSLCIACSIESDKASKDPNLSSIEKQKNQNIQVVKKIVEDYHKTHTYNKSDLFVCFDMAIDVWNMVKTKGINAILIVGNVKEDITDIRQANHVWVVAEVSSNTWIALETTGGFLVCPDLTVCSIYNPRYFLGSHFNNPRELKKAQDALKYPITQCPPGYLPGRDNQCYLACGSGYCIGDSVCVEGRCRGCKPGYILGEDLRCHQPCGGNTYCTGNSVCVDGRCIGCEPGYYLGRDLKCHKL